MPELVAIYLVGSSISLMMSLSFSFSQLSQYNSKLYLQLQKNLALLQLYWNDLDGCLQELKENQNTIEIKKAKTTYWLIGFMSVILSWLGLFLLLVMWFSVRKLIKNKLEIYLFSSDLAFADLSLEKAKAHYETFKTLGFD